MKGQRTCKICSLQRGFVISRFFFISFSITGVKRIIFYRSSLNPGSTVFFYVIFTYLFIYFTLWNRVSNFKSILTYDKGKYELGTEWLLEAYYTTHRRPLLWYLYMYYPLPLLLSSTWLGLLETLILSTFRGVCLMQFYLKANTQRKIWHWGSWMSGQGPRPHPQFW